MGMSDVSDLKPMDESTHRPKLFTIGPQQLKEPPRKVASELCNLPSGLELLGNQVAGHMNNGKTPGMLKCNGTVLKPITKPINGQTEIEFYEELEKTKDEMLLALREFVPKYFGTKVISLNNSEIKCIVLEDLTKDFKEPCIMDIKIGRRTWDPLASSTKIINEDRKYQETKRDLGLSIPGFMVHNISSGRIYRYGKEYGKSLTKDTIKDAVGKFLNADSGLSRELLLQFLVELWKILHWARQQRRIRLFSSSILLVYDARHLKQYLSNNNNKVILRNVTCPSDFMSATNKAYLYRPLSIMNLNDGCSCTGFSGQFTKDGPILNSVPSVTKLVRLSASLKERSKVRPIGNETGYLKRVHSFQNNYDKDLQNMRKEYVDVLDGLVCNRNSRKWATVKMIDFAHVFPSEHSAPDTNYLEGITNLVKLLESFLSETV